MNSLGEMTCKRRSGLQIIEAMNKAVTFVFSTNVAKEEDPLLLDCVNMIAEEHCRFFLSRVSFQQLANDSVPDHCL